MHCPIDGWEAAEPLSRSSWQQIWSARKVGSTEVTGMLRVVTIPAYAGEAEALRDGGFSEERIKKHIADCAERCLRDGEAGDKGGKAAPKRGRGLPPVDTQYILPDLYEIL